MLAREKEKERDLTDLKFNDAVKIHCSCSARIISPHVFKCVLCILFHIFLWCKCSLNAIKMLWADSDEYAYQLHTPAFILYYIYSTGYVFIQTFRIYIIIWLPTDLYLISYRLCCCCCLKALFFFLYFHFVCLCFTPVVWIIS